jgi:hypothetical protein
MKFLRVPQPKCLLGNKVLYVPIHTIQCVTIAGNVLFLKFQGYDYSFHYENEKESNDAAEAFMKQLTQEKSFTICANKVNPNQSIMRMDMPEPCSLAMEELK